MYIYMDSDKAVWLNQGFLLVNISWSHHFESFTVATMTFLTAMEYLCHKWTPLKTNNDLQNIHIKLKIE
jgi:hypothetical protein